MEQVISIYDSALIYYPNIFFPILIILCVLILVAGVIFIPRVIKSSSRIVIIRIKKRKKYTYSIAQICKFFFVELLIKAISIVDYGEMKVKKILKRIGKEIFIHE